MSDFSAEDHGDGLAGIEHLQAALELLGPPGAMLSHLVEVMPDVQRHKAVQMLDQVFAVAQEEPNRVLAMLSERPRVRRLLWDAARAASDAETHSKIAALAAIAARGVADDAAVDEARLRVHTVAGLEPIHLRALMALEAEAGKRAPGDDGARDMTVLLGTSQGLAEAICADLQRLAVAETAGMSFRGLATKMRLSPYGAEILNDLRVQGADPLI